MHTLKISGASCLAKLYSYSNIEELLLLQTA